MDNDDRHHLIIAIKINFRSTEVVKPALQYLYAAQQYLQSPVILHANIFRSPFSQEVYCSIDNRLV